MKKLCLNQIKPQGSLKRKPKILNILSSCFQIRHYGFSSLNEKFCCTYITVSFIKISFHYYFTIFRYLGHCETQILTKFEVFVACHGNWQPFFIIEPFYVYVSIRSFHKVISILVNKSLRIRGGCQRVGSWDVTSKVSDEILRPRSRFQSKHLTK